MTARHYSVIIERASTGNSSSSLGKPGCAAVGDTGQQTRRNFQEALTAHFEAEREIDGPIQEPASSVHKVEITA